MKKILEHSKLIFVILVVLTMLIVGPRMSKLSVAQIINYTPKSLFLAALVIVALFCTKAVIMVVPSYALYIVSGMIFPMWAAILVGYVGLAAELSIGFFIGRWLGKEKVTQLIEKNKKAAKTIGFLTKNNQFVCFLTRLLPMPYPTDLGSMFFAASGMPFTRHLIFSLLGFSGIMVPATIAGTAINNPFSAEFIVPFAISFGFSGLVLVGFILWRKHKNKTSL